MATSTELTAAIPGAEKDPEILSLRTQLVSAGHTKTLLAKTEMMTLHVHCYGPKGGENGMHAHVDEDHIFVVLDGEAQFRGLSGPLPPLRKHQALFLPKGCYYSFSNETEKPLILIRFGASPAGAGGGRRLDPRGEYIPGRAQQHGAVKPVLIENAFFD